MFFENLNKAIFHPLFDNISQLSIVNVLELVIISFVIYKIYKYITGSQAAQLLKGILMLVIALFLTKVFKLYLIGKILESVLSIIIFSLVVIFQPELRRLLGYLGQSGNINRNFFNFGQKKESKNVVNEIVEAVRHLSKSHTGALIVIENQKAYENYTEVGIRMDSQISTELLLTIFHPNTPLHDGAVVIKNDRIAAAGVLLPLTEDPNLSWQYGTRHRAAIGMSECSESICVVVSEETGGISLVTEGKLKKIGSCEELKTTLEELLGYTEPVVDNPKENAEVKFENAFNKKVL